MQIHAAIVTEPSSAFEIAELTLADPELTRHHRAGRFPFDRLIRFYDFTEINQAVEDVRAGITIKAVLRIGKP